MKVNKSPMRLDYIEIANFMDFGTLMNFQNSVQYNYFVYPSIISFKKDTLMHEHCSLQLYFFTKKIEK